MPGDNLAVALRAFSGGPRAARRAKPQVPHAPRTPCAPPSCRTVILQSQYMENRRNVNNSTAERSRIQKGTKTLGFV